MIKYETEVLRRVYSNEEGAYIEIGPCPDMEGEGVRVESNIDYFGEFRFSLEPELAIMLGNAIINTAKEVMGK